MTDLQAVFTYNMDYAPLCIQTNHKESLPSGEMKQHVHQGITKFLQDSRQDGMKHPNAVLDNGMVAAEAAMLYLRQKNEKRRRVERLETDQDKQAQRIVDLRALLVRHWKLDLASPLVVSAFNHRFPLQLMQYSAPEITRPLTLAIKHFLGDVNLKRKGYTVLVRQVVKEFVQSL